MQLLDLKLNPGVVYFRTKQTMSTFPISTPFNQAETRMIHVTASVCNVSTPSRANAEVVRSTVIVSLRVSVDHCLNHVVTNDHQFSTQSDWHVIGEAFGDVPFCS